MLGQMLVASECTLAMIEDPGSPMQLAERVAEVSPAMVILSHLPPEPLHGPAIRSGGCGHGSRDWRSSWGAWGGCR